MFKPDFGRVPDYLERTKEQLRQGAGGAGRAAGRARGDMHCLFRHARIAAGTGAYALTVRAYARA